MRDEIQSRSSRLAVLIDADNASAELIESLLKEVAKYGTAYVKRIYGDWTDSQLKKWKDKLHEFAIQPIQQFRNTVGKNATDSALIIDAMDLLYTQKLDGFCIVSSDSDFTRLASRIRESGLVVYGFGEKKTPKPFINACDRFIFTEILRQLEGVSAVESEENKPIEKSRNEFKDVADSTGDSATNSKLKNNKKLINLLQDAYEAVDEEDGWANLGPFGAQLTKLSPSFDARNYGFKKLGDLIRATLLFEVKEIPHDKNPTVKELHIKLKA
jgi:uncharacterized LabA/DUF88 family protein